MSPGFLWENDDRDFGSLHIHKFHQKMQGRGLIEVDREKFRDHRGKKSKMSIWMDVISQVIYEYNI